MCENGTDNDKKDTGKCKKARLRIEHATKQVTDLNGKLNDAFNTLKTIVRENHPKENENALPMDYPQLVFKHPGLLIEFYIYFQLVVEEDDLHGAIIYGARRTPRYPYILQAKASEVLKAKASEALKAKASEVLKAAPEKEVSPLAQFLVDDQGRIQGSGKKDDEWWLTEEATVREMHYVAIDLIWRRALTWDNEGLLA